MARALENFVLAMDPVYFLAFLVFFYALLVVGLRRYYHRLGYPFLKFGAFALLVETGIQLLEYTGTLRELPRTATVVLGLARMIYAGLLIACATDIAGTALPRRWYSAMAAAFIVASGYVFLEPQLTVIGSSAATVPSSVLLGLTIYMLLRYRSPGSIGAIWLAGLVLVHLGVVWSVPLLGGNLSLIAEFGLVDNIVLLLVGVALVMITSEWTIRDLMRRDERIEEYVEERRRLELQFARAQKLESLGVMAGGIAHDFNNMLTSILGYASLAMRKLPNDSEIRKDLYMVMSGARQAVDLTSQMLIYAGKGALEFEAVYISRVADEMSSLVHSIVPRKIQLVEKLSRDLPALRGDRVQLGQVLMNLVANAVDAIESDGGAIEVATGLADVDKEVLDASFFAEEREPGAYLYLEVKDSGIGMQEDQIGRIFDPFYSEKQTKRGLGLSSLSGIVRQHNGFIRVRSEPGRGSEFTVYFPVLSYQDDPGGVRFATNSSRKFKGNVLLADDDARIRSLMMSILEDDSFRLTCAEDGRDALRKFEQHPDKYDLLVLDCTMPKMSGSEVYKRIRSGGSNVPVVLISGYHQEQVTSSINHDPNGRFVKKPFSVDDFRGEVLAALEMSQTV